MKQHLENLISFQIEKNVIEKRDYIYIKNQLYSLLNLTVDNELKPQKITSPAEALEPILDKLVETKVINDSIVERDLFDSKIMNVFAKLPSDLEKKFYTLREEDAKKATSFLYDYLINLNYIRMDRIKNNKHFIKDSKYGTLEITINLSKPEKDPKDIAKALKQKSSAYPTCVLCKENEGFAGNYNRDSRNQHRLIEFPLLAEKWYFQYSPYIYYNEHAIVLSEKHTPMKISEKTFARLLALVDYFAGYFFGSNADLPIVGGSILTHDHYQGGNYSFPIEKAEPLFKTTIADLTIELLNWPLSTVRLKSKNQTMVLIYANKIFSAWKNYTNEKLNIIAKTADTPHNTVTILSRKKGLEYELDLILRNNRTTEEYPLGIFHPHEDKWHLKKENIGLIEAAGLAILPGRLKVELEEVKQHLLNKKALSENNKHFVWANSFKNQATKTNVDELIERQLVVAFEEILEDCGVFKLNKEGLAAFKDFLEGSIKDEKNNH